MLKINELNFKIRTCQAVIQSIVISYVVRFFSSYIVSVITDIVYFFNKSTLIINLFKLFFLYWNQFKLNVWFVWFWSIKLFQQISTGMGAAYKSCCYYCDCFIQKNQISFTLYPAHSRVGRGNLVLRDSVPHFLPNSGAIACCVVELNAALSLDTRAKKWKYKFK